MKENNLLKSNLEYLRELNKDENDRQTTAENKCVQIISNCGIFLTIIGLMISLLISSRELIDWWFKILLFCLITSIVYFYVRSIILAFNGLDPTKYNYQRGLPDTVNQFTDDDLFKKELINDYVSSIKVNFKLNNEKFGCVIRARQKFIRGIYTTAGMIILLVFYISFMYIRPTENVQKVNVISDDQKKGLAEVKNSIDSLNRTVSKFKRIK